MFAVFFWWLAPPFPLLFFFFHHWLVVTLQQVSAEVSKVKIYLYICQLYGHTFETRLHCILTVISFSQLLRSWVKLGVEEWKSFTLVLCNLQWLGATVVAPCSAPSSETLHHDRSATYLIKLPKQANAFFTSNCAHPCAHTTLLYFAIGPSIAMQQPKAAE